MMDRTAVFVAAVAAGLAVTLATGTAQSPNAFGVPSADKPTPGAGDQGRARIARARAGCRRGAPKCSRATAWSRRAIRSRPRPGSRSCGRAATRSTPPSPPARCSTSPRRTTPASAAISSRSSGSAKDKKLYALNSGGWAPAGWTPEFFTQKLGVKSVPNSGVNSATVPGAISGYDALLKRFGTVGFKEAFERAARLADEGWGIAERRHSDLRGATNGLQQRSGFEGRRSSSTARRRRSTASSAIPAWRKRCA